MDSTVIITLPNGAKVSASRGTPAIDFVRTSIGKGLAQAAYFVKLDGTPKDLSTPLVSDANIEVVTTKSPEALEMARHDAAHIVADAAQRLFPGTQVTIGPAIEDGFYYDFYREENGAPKPFTPEELERIEALANEIVRENSPFVRSEVSAEDAKKLFSGMGEKFKVEIVEDIAAKGATTFSLYTHGKWVDFCLGPHGPSTGRVGVIKLLSTSGAYWRGDHTKTQLQRVYGTAFFDKASLDAFLAQREEAQKRDHRRLGKDLDLFHFHQYSPGAAFWTPKGTMLYTTLATAMRRWTKDAGYVEIKTPLLYERGLWEISGHWDKYRENMFLVEKREKDDPATSLKPMNCPSHHLYYTFEKRSHRDLPLRLHTQDVLFRNEPTGSLGGLTRVRQFAQDDAHIYCREDQLGSEVRGFVGLLNRVYSAFGLAYRVKLSTRPAQRIGDDALWDRAEGALKSELESLGLDFEIKAGDGAFYGPKIDFDVLDAIGRSWQLGTFQVDYNAPERFDLTYVGEDNREHRPVVLHRAIYGSFERFIAILIEHYAGAFPLWLAPLQVRIITVADRQAPFAREVEATLAAEGFRVEYDDRGSTMQKKIAEAQTQKIPYTLVLGDREVEQRTVAPRQYKQQGETSLPLADFVARLRREAVPPP